jgi:hypothetical protein
VTGYYPNSADAPPGWDSNFWGFGRDLGSHEVRLIYVCPPDSPECPPPTERVSVHCYLNGSETTP